MQIPPLPAKRVTQADVLTQLAALHDCVHLTQRQTAEGFDKLEGKMDRGFTEAHNRITGVSTEVAYLKGVQEGTARALGVHVDEPDGKAPKPKTPFALLSQPVALLMAGAASIGGVGVYQVAVHVWPQIWALLIGIHHAIMSLGA